MVIRRSTSLNERLICKLQLTSSIYIYDKVVWLGDDACVVCSGLGWYDTHFTLNYITVRSTFHFILDGLTMSKALFIAMVWSFLDLMRLL